MNIIDVDGGETLEIAGVPIPLSPEVSQAVRELGAESYGVGVRPEHLRIADDGIPGEVTVVEELGSESFLFITCIHQNDPIQLVVRGEGQTTIDRGDHVHVNFAGPLHVFGPDGERVGD